MSTADSRARVVATGAWGIVECALRLSGEVPAKIFLENDLELIREKGKDDPQATARARFMFLFQQMANYGPRSLSRKRFKSEMEGLSAFCHEVHKKQIRFPCFPDGLKWVLTHGFVKPGAKKGLGRWPESHIARALTIRAEYFQLKNAASRGKKR